MKWRHTDHSEEHYHNAPTSIQKAFDKQARLLSGDIRHPSLHAKKYDEVTGLWQARITQSWRFYFVINSDEYIIVAIRNHPK